MSALVRPEDDGRHEPPDGASERWQESWALIWYDPDRRAGGFHHLGLQSCRGLADVWDFLVLEGKVIANFQSLTLPLPADDLSDLHLGPLHVRTKAALTSHLVTDDHGVTRSEVLYQAYERPSRHTVELDGAEIGKDHYETVGGVDGVLTHDGRTVEVRGVGIQDHSWGPRNYGAILTHRWIWATFGPDLFVSSFSGWTPLGTRTTFGYVCERGTYRPLRDARYGLRVDEDGHTPTGCDAHLVTVDGRTYHLTGQADVGSVVSHHDGFFMTDAFATFEMEGRTGAGVIECHELGGPAPWHRELLGL